MASQRRVNWISQQRVDVPDMRSVESAVSNDFDTLIQAFVTGTGEGYVLRGFEISMAGAIGGAASGLQMIVDPGAIFHVNSSQSGTFYLVPTGTLPQQLNSATNTIVDGAFAPSSINYVSLEYERYIDDSTSSQVYLWDPTTNNETTKTTPRAQILRYRLKITTSLPPSNYLPLATVTTDSGNNVVRIDNNRPRLFSQGTGGFSPNPFNTFTWSEGRDAGPTYTTSNSVNPFQGGDQAIESLKDWMDAVTSVIQEIKGTTYWTSLSSSGSLESLRADLGNTVVTGSGTITHSATTPGLVNWSDAININVIGSRLTYTLAANPTSTNISLADNQVAYITLTRGETITPSLIFTNSSMIVTSVGAISWTGPLQSGDWIKLGSDTDQNYYQINTVDSLTQVTLKTAYAGASTGAGGAKAKYAFGSYQSSATPSTARDIYIADRAAVPSGEDVFWLMVRQDNGGSIARVYVRFIGVELEAGDTEDIAAIINKNILLYTGSPIESATKPQYASALNPGSVAEVQTLTFGDASTIPQSSYFEINSSGDFRLYYVWFNKDAAGTDPMAANRTGVQVNITTGMTSAQVANAVSQAFAVMYYDDYTVTQSGAVLTVTNNSAGSCAAAVDFNVGTPGFATAVVTSGTGQGNFAINDGDNLTLAIKKIDLALGQFLEALDTPTYDESTDISTAVASGTLLTLPVNSRLSNVQQKYTVGRGVLTLNLNGQVMRLGLDWAEVGNFGAASSQIQILRPLVAGDYVHFRLGGGGGGAGGGGTPGVQGPPGPSGPPGHDALGGPITVSTKNASYTLQLADKLTKVNAAGGDVVITLPPASSSAGYVFYVKKIDATAHNMIIQANGSDLIDGQATITSTVQWISYTLVSDGATWSLL